MNPCGFCRPIGLVAGFNVIISACLAGVPSCSVKMCPEFVLVYFMSLLILAFHHIYTYLLAIVTNSW